MSVPELVPENRDNFTFQTVACRRTDGSDNDGGHSAQASPGNVRSFWVSMPKDMWMHPSASTVDQELSTSGVSEVQVRRLLEENARLRSLLIAHSIPIPEAAQPTLHPHQASNSAPEVRKPGVATAEQRIALFRSLFRGRKDIYAICWENNDGRSGYMPKADRDWKSYLSAKDEDRKKVDRLTRTYRPLTDDGLHGHLVGEQTVGI